MSGSPSTADGLARRKQSCFPGKSFQKGAPGGDGCDVHDARIRKSGVLLEDPLSTTSAVSAVAGVSKLLISLVSFFVVGAFAHNGAKRPCGVDGISPSNGVG